MVVCKYYRQGNCRFGQYCQFEHINTFGANNKVDSYNEDEYIVVLVAKEMLNAERGGQWLLSCFAPLKDKPCIPGMEDLSPEEVRWEMYQAQNNGMVEQAKLHFQQLCRDMKAKRDAFKNPTRETLTKLKELLGTGHKNTRNDNASGKPSSFAFATPQLGLPSSTSSSNVFGNKTFGNQSNPFSGSFTSTSNTSIFGRSSITSNPVFGSTPTFGSNLGVFSGGTSTNTVFGGITNTSTFNTGQNTQTFGSSGSIFSGGTSQPVFGQPSIFGTNNQVNNVFARHQTSQTPISVFNSGATSSSSLFSGTSSQSNASMFAGAKTSTANPFSGSSNLQTTNSIFGSTPQPETPAFGGAPVFGGPSTFGNNSSSIFGEKPTFGSSSSIFGGSNAATPAFSSAQSTNAFGVTTSTPSGNIFGNAQGNTPPMSTSSASPFGVTSSTTTSPFATAVSQFEATSTAAFSTFGMNTGTATTASTSSTPFGTTNTGVTFGTSSTSSSPFTSTVFSDVKNSPFGPSVTSTTMTTNSFTPQEQQQQQQQITSPFGTFAQNQTFNTAAENGPFGKPTFGVTMTTTIISDDVYSLENQLTDDEKSMYLAEKFTFGKIPLKPPTKEIS
ncbi:nuclear pore complex protein DDB_G0274915-like isoform X2 [Frieseomelitta varia]|uniref:nuclear pore complex protein DDB_G0274915-like isoform X2 n=1 Tax=Frieseomelitta varia TaxID=561572 RepID=UPI001CB6A845|nr:nuclear pore complex protein DDB_G0274915-like isoform X2 [Frieseomelitta varia]